MYTTKLYKLCEIFNWQGGTIHQANKEIENCLQLTNVNVLQLEPNEFERLVRQLKINYPIYIKYLTQKEELHNGQ